VNKYFTGDGHPPRQVNHYHNTQYNPYKSTNADVTLTVTSEGAALKHKDQESERRHPRKSGIRKEGT
jgi:predicted peroxiredoxin